MWFFVKGTCSKHNRSETKQPNSSGWNMKNHWQKPTNNICTMGKLMAPATSDGNYRGLRPRRPPTCLPWVLDPWVLYFFETDSNTKRLPRFRMCPVVLMWEIWHGPGQFVDQLFGFGCGICRTKICFCSCNGWIRAEWWILFLSCVIYLCWIFFVVVVVSIFPEVLRPRRCTVRRWVRGFHRSSCLAWRHASMWILIAQVATSLALGLGMLHFSRGFSQFKVFGDL